MGNRVSFKEYKDQKLKNWNLVAMDFTMTEEAFCISNKFAMQENINIADFYSVAMTQYLTSDKLHQFVFHGVRDQASFGNVIEQECILTSLEYFKFIQFCAEHSLNPNTLINLILFSALNEHLSISKEIFFPNGIGSYGSDQKSFSRTLLFNDEEINYLSVMSSTFNQIAFSEFRMMAQL